MLQLASPSSRTFKSSNSFELTSLWRRAVRFVDPDRQIDQVGRTQIPYHCLHLRVIRANHTIARHLLRSPFLRAARRPAHPAASSALVSVIDIKRVDCPSSRMAHLPFPGAAATVSLPKRRTSRYASPSTWEEKRDVEDTLASTTNIVARSAATAIISPLRSPVDRRTAAQILNKVVTPYNADAFERYLSDYGLYSKFPMLVTHLRQGFPLTKGSFSFPRVETPPNHSSCDGHTPFLKNFLADEVALGRMSGPFSREDMELIYGDTFVTTPLLLVTKKGALGEPDKIRVCRNSSKSYSDGLSVNDFIDSDDFSTEWTTAADVAEIVGILLSSCSPVWVIICLVTIRSWRRSLSLLRCFLHPQHFMSHMNICFLFIACTLFRRDVDI